MTDVAARLARALLADAARAGVAVTLAPLASRPWMAALFTGATHTTTLESADDEAAAAWLAALPEADLPVHGWIVDVSVEAIARADGRLTATLALLTIAA